MVHLPIRTGICAMVASLPTSLTLSGRFLTWLGSFDGVCGWELLSCHDIGRCCIFEVDPANPPPLIAPDTQEPAPLLVPVAAA